MLPALAEVAPALDPQPRIARLQLQDLGEVRLGPVVLTELEKDAGPGEPDFRIAGSHCHRRLEFCLGLLWFAELSIGPGPEQSQPGVGQRRFALDQLL